MKTLKLTTVISLVLIFAGINANYAAQKGNTYRVMNNALVRYQVTVHVPADVKICNLWIIRVTDANGVNVAPPQSFFGATSTYNFYEAGPVRGVRIARMEIMPNGENFLCAPEFSVRSDINSGVFLSGRTYPFDLYPSKEGSKH